MRLAARLLVVGTLGLAGVSSAAAQNLEQFFDGIGRLGQPRRAVTQAEWERLSPGELRCVDDRLRRNRRSVNTLIGRGIGPTDDRVAGLVGDCRAAADARTGAAAARDNPAYEIDGMQLGSNVGAGSADYSDYTCAPSQQYAGFTGCQRQTAERARRRTVTESTAFLHTADGTAVYINQNVDPVAMDDNDARDEIERLSETYGKATVLPAQDARGVPSGLIASWGAVSLQPLPPERRAALAAGTDDRPGILIDGIGNLQQSAQLGLPIYQLGGGAGYVWSASWNGRGRGSLRVLAIDASKLPGVAEVKPAEPVVVAAQAPAVAAAAPETPKPVEATPPPAPAAPAVAPTPKTAAPPADVRVVGPPIELRAAAPAPGPTPATATTNANGGNGLVIFLMALVVVLLGAVGYLYRQSRVAPAAAVQTPAPEAATDVVTAPASEKMDLPALVPTESPDSIVSSAPDMEAPKDAAMAPAVGDVGKRSTT